MGRDVASGLGSGEAGRGGIGGDKMEFKDDHLFRAAPTIHFLKWLLAFFYILIEQREKLALGQKLCSYTFQGHARVLRGSNHTKSHC